MPNKLNLLVAAGGTGGHLFPALAVVDELKNQLTDDFDAFFVGNKSKIEGKVVPANGYSLTELPIRGIQNRFDLWNLMIPLYILRSTRICTNLLKRNQIKAVLCAGAYLSYPAGLAARGRKIPLILMESNVYPGKTIKALASRANLIITSFDVTKQYLKPGGKTIIKNLGNPVRNELMNLPDRTKSIENMGLDKEKKTILVFGGSLGARSINNAVQDLIKSGLPDDLQIIWQTGNNYQTDIKDSESVKIYNFIDDMATMYSIADLVVARSGATTISELTVTAKPSVLIPYPHAANNHQEYNARLMMESGASVLVHDNDSYNELAKIVKSIINDEARLKSMSASAGELAKPNATSDAANEILNLI